MKYREIAPVERVRELLRLEPDGELYWQPREGQRAWNTKFAGKPAFTAINAKGYRHGALDGQGILAHRAVWVVAHGEWPQGQVDHIDGDPRNNRPENLRVVESVVNQRNMARFTTNTSGYTGVFLKKNTGKWGAYVKVGGRSIHLGYFDDKEQARAARLGAERVLGYHPNHGREKWTNSPVVESGLKRPWPTPAAPTPGTTSWPASRTGGSSSGPARTAAS